MDTFAWIEHFAGSTQGEQVRAYVDGGEATPMMVIAELADRYAREGMDAKDSLKFIEKVDGHPRGDEVAEAAGLISAERRTKIESEKEG